VAASPSPLAGHRVVALPDLFVDTLVHLPPWSTTRAHLDALAANGGGNLPVAPSHVKLGGNAGNLAVALARLGAQVDLIAHTDEFGHRLLQRAAAGTDLRMEGVRVGERGSVTLGLECGPSNVMLSHAGPLHDFGPHRLTARDWERIESADAVALVNWAQNARGTRLLRSLATRLHRRGIPLYLDTGDVRHRAADLAALRRDRAIWRGVTAFGLNQNELAAFQGGASLEHAHGLADELGTRLDLHTRTWAATIADGRSVQVPAGRTPARRLTGAGDTWNAGNLAGYLLGLPDRQRLRLAHRVATRYVTGRSGLPPTPKDVSP